MIVWLGCWILVISLVTSLPNQNSWTQYIFGISRFFFNLSFRFSYVVNCCYIYIHCVCGGLHRLSIVKINLLLCSHSWVLRLSACYSLYTGGEVAVRGELK